MRKLSNFLVVVMFLSTALVSCGPSEEKIKRVQDSYASLVELMNQTTKLVESARNRGLLDSEAIDEYNKAVAAVNEIGEVDLSKSSNSELDDVLESIAEMRIEISALKGILEGLQL